MMRNTDLRKNPKLRLRSVWRGWIKPILVAVLVMSSFRSAVADWNDVPTGSMKPTILEGERIFVNKLAYDLKLPFTKWHVAEWSGPQHGDVVVFDSPADGVRLVKRVVGLPGDRIEMRAERLTINGQPLEYRPVGADTAATIQAYGSDFPGRINFADEYLGDRPHPVMITPEIPAMRDFGPLTVPPDEYFVMGDNRDNSRDSRYFGAVPRGRIVGRVSAVVFSVDPRHYYKPRWQRFFTPLP